LQHRLRVVLVPLLTFSAVHCDRNDHQNSPHGISHAGSSAAQRLVETFVDERLGSRNVLTGVTTTTLFCPYISS